jgi:ADP-ribosylglycohydrolase
LEAALLKAVNLGGDTDTIGAIAGGLAALHYGYENIPRAWREAIVKKDKIVSLCGLIDGVVG